MKWFKNISHPTYWNNYIAHFSSKQQATVEHLRFVVFDTETTGLNPKQDRILSIGCIAINELKIKVSDQLEIYLKQEQFNADTVKIHGLLRDGKIEKITEREAVMQFLEYIENAVLVAHHAAFDVAMINKALERLGLPKLKNKVLDTGYLFKKTKPNANKTHYSLDELAKHFKIPLHDRHTASGDAYITALLFLKLVAALKPKTLKDLQSRQRIGLL